MHDPWMVPRAPRHVADVGRTLGETILEWRTRRGWSQRSLETISGVNQSTISRLERGLSNGMGLINLGRLAWALNAEEAVLRALAAYGEEEIRNSIQNGFGPTGEDIDRALNRAGPPVHGGRAAGHRRQVMPPGDAVHCIKKQGARGKSVTRGTQWARGKPWPRAHG